MLVKCIIPDVILQCNAIICYRRLKYYPIVQVLTRSLDTFRAFAEEYNKRLLPTPIDDDTIESSGSFAFQFFVC
jgi:hypothetical protein